MNSSLKSGLNRREFIQAAGSIVALSAVRAQAAGRGVSLIIDPADPVAGAGPVQWAAKELEQSLTSRGIAVQKCERVAQARREDFCIVAAGSKATVSSGILKASRATVEVSEALGLVPGEVGNRKILLACGHDVRGLVYALLDLADRVHNAPEAGRAQHTSD